MGDKQIPVLIYIKSPLSNPVIKYGQTYEEGWYHGQVRYKIRRLPPQDDQEDGDHAARQVYVFVLRQRGHETLCDGHLGLQELQEGGGGRRVRVQHDGGRHGAQRGETSPRDEGDVDAVNTACVCTRLQSYKMAADEAF